MNSNTNLATRPPAAYSLDDPDTAPVSAGWDPYEVWVTRVLSPRLASAAVANEDNTSEPGASLIPVRSDNSD